MTSPARTLIAEAIRNSPQTSAEDLAGVVLNAIGANGFVVVPREASLKMFMRGGDMPTSDRKRNQRIGDMAAKAVYERMIAIALGEER